VCQIAVPSRELQELFLVNFHFCRDDFSGYGSRAENTEAWSLFFCDLHFRIENMEELKSSSVVEIPPFPIASPPEFELVAEDVQFNAAIHLDIQEPKTVYLLNGYEKVEVTPEPKEQDGLSQMAFTTPFKLLSDEGVAALRQVINREKELARSTERIPKCMRGLAYKSKFIQDLNRSEEVREMLSSMAGMPLVPHSFAMSYAHTNIGLIGDQKAVDQWHVDSVNFVMVILMSDMTGASGGELQLIKKPRAEAFKELYDTANNVPEEDLLTVQYPGPGWAIFMQGSEMVHHVTSVKNAKEPRITVVNSYMPANAFVPDQTVLYTFRKEPTTAYFEFARHKAWRAQKQLDRLINSPVWVTDRDLLAQELRKVCDELEHSADLIAGLMEDKLEFYKENAETTSKPQLEPLKIMSPESPASSTDESLLESSGASSSRSEKSIM
jgi:hypothetical protein